MHDGSLKTLEEVVEHYNKGGIKNQWLHQDVRELKLTDEQKIHRGNANAAIAALDWLRNELEKAAYYYDTSEDVTRVRRELSEISL